MPVANKHLEKAERMLQKGKLEAALEEYLLAWKDEPANDSIVHTVAELYYRLNKLWHSRECYNFLFDKALEKSDGHKLLEVLRKMQLLGPVDPARMIAAAQVLEKQRPELASEQYQKALDAAGDKSPEVVLQCLQGLARVQPASLELNRRLAATAAEMGHTALAAAAYKKLADLLEQVGKWPEAIESLRQICRLAPKDRAARLALARVLLKSGDAPGVRALWKDHEYGGDPEAIELLAKAHLAENQLEKAEDLYWKLALHSTEAADALCEIARRYEEERSDQAQVRTLRTLEEHLASHPSSVELTSLAERLSQLDYRVREALESLSRILDRIHLDFPLVNTLNRIYELHFASGDFRLAAETLDRLISVDPYNSRFAEKLERLEGKVDPAVLRELGIRLGIGVPANEAGAGGDAASPEHSEAAEFAKTPDTGAGTLRDLILQGEIFLQYGMEDKARERLERIAKLFPGEEERNEELANLYQRAAFVPSLPGSEPESSADGRDLRTDLKRVSEISRNISRQSTVKSVLSAAVNDIGRHWQLSRCLVGLATPSRPPSIALEYISGGVQPSDPSKLAKLVMGLQQAIAGRNYPLVAEDVTSSPELAGLQEILAALQVNSLAAIPLRDTEQEIGILVLEQCGAVRSWKANDLAGLEAVAEQIVLAVANVRLRSLMKALAVTDEQSGLLHRDSYLTCLLSEVERMRSQKTPLSVVLLDFSERHSRPEAKTEDALQDFVQKFSASVISHLRQNDIAVKYTAQALALILPATRAKDAGAVTEKMRKLAQSTAGVAGDRVPHMAIGVAEALSEGSMDNTDRVTELINRLERALQAAHDEGPGQLKVLEPPVVAHWS
jgi:tetratricopeptide (TPR) repeat protein